MVALYSRFILVCVILLGVIHMPISFAVSATEQEVLRQEDIHQHRQWNTLLKKHVQVIEGGSASQVDYSGFKTDFSQLQAYLETLSAVPESTFLGWPKSQRLAFLVNAYNAFTIQLILTKYPELESIKELGSFFSSPWKKDFISLLGKKRSLDEIEHEMIRVPGVYDEPRIHFAVNCASIGCPALRVEAFVASNLEVQLEQATQDFLKSRSRNYLRDGTLYVSKIFDWYEEDFEKGWRGANKLSEFLALYSASLSLSKKEKASLLNGSIKIKYTKYDWNLNKLH